MRVALCLYGQPRKLEQGYKYIKEQIIDVFEPDVFLHTWDSKEDYRVSPWRYPISATPLQNINDIYQMYKPLSSLIEPARIFDVDTSLPGYLKASPAQQRNASNILSQIHSRQMVRDILFAYTRDNNITYDFIIATRFDIKIQELPLPQEQIIFFSDLHMDRPTIFNDNLVICNQQDFIDMFNIETNCSRYLTSGPRNGNGPSILNMEELLTCSLIDNSLLVRCRKTAEIKIELL